MYCGPKKPPNVQMAIKLVVDDLEAPSLPPDGGVETLDGSSNSYFIMRPRLICTTQDYIGARDVACQAVTSAHLLIAVTLHLLPVLVRVISQIDLSPLPFPTDSEALFRCDLHMYI